MGIRKPGLSVGEARRLAAVRSAASEQIGDGSKRFTVPQPLKQLPPSSDPKSTAPEPRIFRHPVKKTQVFVSALLPAQGVSRIFDVLVHQYPPPKSLQMILRRALDDYEEMLADGSFQKAPTTYPSDGSAASGELVQTSHMMQNNIVKVARAYFDPVGLESTRAFGFKLATAALAAFFSREANR